MKPRSAASRIRLIAHPRSRRRSNSRTPTVSTSMKRTHRLIASISVLLALVPPAVARELGAQNSRVIVRRMPVTVVLVDSLPQLRAVHNYVAVISRRPTADPSDVIMLPRDAASGQALDAAVRTLLSARATHGDQPSHYRTRAVQEITIGVRTSQPGQEWARRYAELSQRIVDSLRRAPRQHIRGIGNVPALRFSPPMPSASGKRS